jgi:hypothetical protein
LAKDNTVKMVDLGLVHSSAADSPISNIFNRLSADGDVEKGVSPNFLGRNWPPAFKDWPTKSVRDAFYASPVFPRLLNAATIKETIARGVESGMLAYVGKGASGKYQPFAFGQSVNPADIEFSDDMFVIPAETARAYLEGQVAVPPVGVPGSTTAGTGAGVGAVPSGPTITTQPTPTPPVAGPAKIAGIRGSGELPPQKWMNFYTKVLSRFAATHGLRLTIGVEVSPPDGLSKQALEETQNALRELGLDDRVKEE